MGRRLLRGPGKDKKRASILARAAGKETKVKDEIQKPAWIEIGK